MEQISNSNLAQRNQATSCSTVGENLPRPGQGTAHNAECECNGHGYFVTRQIACDDRGYVAPDGHVVLSYCGLEDAIEAEAIIAAYGTVPNPECTADKWGTIVVEALPREAEGPHGRDNVCAASGTWVAIALSSDAPETAATTYVEAALVHVDNALIERLINAQRALATHTDWEEIRFRVNGYVMMGSDHSDHGDLAEDEVQALSDLVASVNEDIAQVITDDFAQRLVQFDAVGVDMPMLVLSRFDAPRFQCANKYDGEVFSSPAVSLLDWRDPA